MTNTTDKLREMNTNEHVKVLEQMRASGFDFDFGNEQYAALDAAIAALKALDAEPDADLELIWHSVSDNAETNAAYRRLKARLAALKAEKPTIAVKRDEEIERLAMALRLAEEHINALTPEWYSAGQRVLAEIRAALAEASND